MSYLIKKNIPEWLGLFIAFAIFSFFSIYFADKAQTVGISTIVKIIGIILIFFIYFIFNKISVFSLLVPLTFMYIRPANYLFYMFVVVIFLLFILHRIWVEDYSVEFPYLKSFIVVMFFGIVAVIKAMVLAEGIQLFFSVIITPMILIFVIMNSKFNYDNMIKYLKYLVFAASIVGLYGILIALKNPTERSGSTWITAMTINAFYIFSFFIAIGLALREKKLLNKALYYIATIIILFGMLFTYTRIVLLSVALGCFLLIIRIKEMRKFAILILLMIIAFIPSSLMERAGRNIFEDPSTIIRLLAWINSVDLFIDNPIFGIGFNTWDHIYGSIVPFHWLDAEHAHNVWFRLLLELGIIGLVAYFSIIFNIMYRFFRKIRNEVNYNFHYTILIATLSVLFSCLTDVFIVKIPITIFFWITLAIMLKMEKVHVFE